jgi:uncharacterized protein
MDVRNVKFELAAVPRHWHGGRRSVTAFFDNLSIFFPLGERFFIASVKAHRDHITDEQLRADVRAFTGQEGCHGREHQRYNAMLAAHGYPIAAMEGRVERLLARVARRVPVRWQLAATCALEHFTALLAHILLRDPEVLAGADPTMAALWRWHAAEENEHKAVAFDVFRAAGGTEAERMLVMALASVIFWAKVAEHQVRLMHHDRTLWSPREWRALARFLLVRPGALRKMVRPYLAYYRPGFHPWQLADTAPIEAWKREYETSEIYRRSAA